jgi:thioredoxin reductase (NADPH)
VIGLLIWLLPLLDIRLIVIRIYSIVIAVGGRPTQLDIPGGEYAITSDDIFMLSQRPRKTLVVGAGYVALECAGFLSGLHQGNITIAVRSKLLRGFDDNVVQAVETYMALVSHIIIKKNITIKLIEKMENGKLIVCFSDNTEEIYDTVLVAVGRYADTNRLGLENIGIKIHEKSGKIECVNEQTAVKNVYAIGDIVHNTPELTPVAIMAGKLLAKRLFQGMIGIESSSITLVHYT